MKYDRFLSHNSKDKPHVRALADWLGKKEVKVFLDEKDLEPGDVLTDALGSAMDESRSAVIGRVDESRALAEKLQDCRLAVIVGPSGKPARHAKVIAAVVHGYFYSANDTPRVLSYDYLVSGYQRDVPVWDKMMKSTNCVHMIKPFMKGHEENIDTALGFI